MREDLYDFKLTIALQENFTEKEIEVMEWQVNTECENFYCWNFSLDSNKYQLKLSKKTENINLKQVI